MSFDDEYKISTETTSSLEEQRDRIESMLFHMMLLQDASNRSLYPDWQAKDLGWDTAILVESAELVDHLAWKWWKAGKDDVGQAQMEVVDIWHFFLSLLILQEPALLFSSKEDAPREERAAYYRAVCTLRNMATRIMRSPEPDADLDVSKVTFHVKKFLSIVLSGAYPANESLYHFLPVVTSVGLSFDSLYHQYIAKNVLNSFRWSNGYREGTYIKDWLGQEDNQYLTELLTSTDKVGDELQEYLELGLQLRYKEVVGAGA